VLVRELDQIFQGGNAVNITTSNIVTLVVGIVLLIMGFNEYGTFGSRAGRLLGTGLSNEVLFYFSAGGVCTAYSVLQLLKKK
jgi:hypothetical protein